MIDRAKVIKELECCSQMSGHVCQKCPYISDCNNWSAGIPHLASDALELLKKQEALPIVYETNKYTGLPVAHCPSCGEYLVQFHSGVDGKESRFCYYCGQAVKWE